MRTGLWVVLGVVAFGCGNSGSGKPMVGGGGDRATAGTTAAGTAGAGATSNPSGGTDSGDGGSDAPGGSDTAGGVGGTEAPEEPLPDPDLTGLVPTSGKWLLYSEGSLGTTDLRVLDLGSQQEHAANPDELPIQSGSRSPNGAVFTFSGQDTSLTNNLAIIRFADAGFVPAKPIAGFEAEPGNFSAGAYDGRSRFFLATRFGATTGVEVVDSILGQRVGFLEYELSFSLEFASKGPYFAYRYSGGQTNDGRIASVTAEGGLSEPFDLPPMTYPTSFAFSDDGQHVYFNTKQDDVVSFNYIDLPDPTPHRLPIATEGEASDVVYPGPSSESVIAWLRRESGRYGMVQVFFDGRPRVDLSDPENHVRLFGTNVSDDHQLVQLDYVESLELVQVEPRLRFPLEGKTILPPSGPGSTGMLGRYVHYLRDGILRIATIDAGALVDAAVSEAGDETNLCPFAGGEPVSRMAYYNDALTQLVFVDMAARPPAVVLRYDVSSADATVGCPMWQPDGKAFLINEKSPTKNRAFVSDWSGAEPTTPVLVKESDQQLLTWAFSYR